MKKLFTLFFCIILSSCGYADQPNANDGSESRSSNSIESRDEYAPKVGIFGGEIVLRTNSDPKSFNPVVAQENTTTLVTSLIYEGLTNIDPITTDVTPELAKSWTHSKDGLTYTFELRDDVYWSDGEQFTADDVVFTFDDLYFNPDIPNSAKDVLAIDGELFSVEKVDEFTVRFILPKKFAPFLINASGQGILPEHIHKPQVEAGTFQESLGVAIDPSESVGSGAFLLESFTPGENIVLKRNSSYWKMNTDGESLPYLDRVVYKVIKTDDTALLQFQNGELDAYGVRGSDYPILKPKESEGNFTLFNLGPTSTKNFLSFNLNDGLNENGEPFIDPKKRELFEQKAFRQAISHAIDRDSMAEIVLNGFGSPMWGPTTESTGYFYNPDVIQYPYDPEKAKEMLKQLGYEDRDDNGYVEDTEGEELSITFLTNSDNSERVEMAEMIRKDLEDIGIKVYFTPMDFNNLVTKLTATFDWEMVLIGFTGGIEPHSGQNVWHSSGGLHMWDPMQESPEREWEKRIDEIFSQGVQELDRVKRKELYDEWQMIASEELPLVYTVVPNMLVAVRNTFGNLYPTNYGGAIWNIEEIYILNPL